MGRVSLSDGLAIVGLILAIVLVVLDKAGKLKGPALLTLLGVAACMAIPLLFSVPWVTGAPSGLPIFARRMLMLFLLGAVWAGVSVWITNGDIDKIATNTLHSQLDTQEKREPPVPPIPNAVNVFDPALADWRIKYAPYDLTLHDLYLTDFKSVQQRSSGAIFADTAQTISVQYTIATDLALRSKFLIFYVTASAHTAATCKYLAKQYNFIFEKAPQLLVEQKGVGDSGTISTKEAIFTQRIYIYHETYLDSETTAAITKAYSQEGISVILRSTDYLSTKRLEVKVRQQM